jgi:hypothetical protein
MASDKDDADLESRGSDKASLQAIASAPACCPTRVAKASSMLGSSLAFTTTTRTPAMGDTAVWLPEFQPGLLTVSAWCQRTDL